MIDLLEILALERLHTQDTFKEGDWGKLEQGKARVELIRRPSDAGEEFRERSEDIPEYVCRYCEEREEEDDDDIDPVHVHLMAKTASLKVEVVHIKPATPLKDLKAAALPVVNATSTEEPKVCVSTNEALGALTWTSIIAATCAGI